MSFPRYESYKDSGAAWLNEVPSDWRIEVGRRIFAQIRRPAEPADEQLSATQKYGVIPQSTFMVLEDQKVVLALKGTDAFRHVDADDFVISLRSFQGGIERSRYSGCVSPAYTVLKASRTVDPAYWAYLLKSESYIAALQTATDGIREGKTISYEQFGNIAVPVPTGSEQRHIADFLDRETSKIDALVEEQQRLIELLKEKRQAVISHAVTKGLNPNATMKDSDIEWLGEVPTHWKVASIRRVIRRIEQGWSPECVARPAEPNEWGIVKSGCVNRGVFVEQENKALPETLDPLPEYEIRPGNVLMSRASGSPELVGSTAYITSTRAKLMLSDKIFRIHLRVGIDKQFFVALFNSYLMRSQIERAISGAEGLANNLPQSAMKRFFCALPPLAEQEQILAHLEANYTSLDTLTAEAQGAITLLQERRTALISAAVTGKIDIRGDSVTSSAVEKSYSTGFARQLLAAEILHDCHEHPTTGRVKLQKLIHLCEYVAEIDEVNGSYLRKAAGPFDNKVMFGIASGLSKQRWFSEVKDGTRTFYRPLEKAGEHKKYLAHWEGKILKIHEVLGLLGKAATQQCEIVSTLYAAWNDLLIEGRVPSDEEIIHEASSPERWHENKAKIPSEKWPAALNWMREKGLVPKGYGRHTKRVDAVVTNKIDARTLSSRSGRGRKYFTKRHLKTGVLD